MSKLILHLGCGKQRFKDCVNIDCRKTPAVDKVCNILSLPYESGSVDGIIAHHVIEHVPYHYLPTMLGTWCDLLKVGGTIELSFPDADYLCEMFYKRQINLDNLNHLMMGNSVDVLQFPEQTHKAALTYEFVKDILERNGIKNIRRITGKKYTQHGITVSEKNVDTKIHSARMLHFKGVKK